MTYRSIAHKPMLYLFARSIDLLVISLKLSILSILPVLTSFCKKSGCFVCISYSFVRTLMLATGNNPIGRIDVRKVQCPFSVSKSG